MKVNCLRCNGNLSPFSPKEDAKEKYLKCNDCGAVMANVSIPLYPKTKYLHQSV
jgi:hypothetical protein